MNLEEQYFNWLYGRVAAVTNPNPNRGFFLLVEQMHNKEFVWFIPNDDNRSSEGVGLRDEFLNDHPLSEGSWFSRARSIESWLEEPCSMLELFIALSQRLAFETYTDGIENTEGAWFYKLLRNIDISQYNDSVYQDDIDSGIRVNQALEQVINRTYKRDGTGGLFPVRKAQKDFRKVELWYQMAEYVREFNGV